MRYFFFGLALFTALLFRIDRFFLKKNQGFCLHYISSALKMRPEWNVDAAIPDAVRQQKFTYLAKGSQSYVFESEDKQHVIKFYKFPSHMRTIPWLKHPFAYHRDENRKKIKEHNEKRFTLSCNSYLTAFKELPLETAVSYVHLNPTSHLNCSVTLVDHLGMHYDVSLDKMSFVIQKKAKLLFPVLEQSIQQADLELSKTIIKSVIGLIETRCRKGIADLDTMINKNCGWLDGRAILIDVGRLVSNPSVVEPDQLKKEVVHHTQLLSDYLQGRSPELFAYYRELVQ